MSRQIIRISFSFNFRTMSSPWPILASTASNATIGVLASSPSSPSSASISRSMQSESDTYFADADAHARDAMSAMPSPATPTDSSGGGAAAESHRHLFATPAQLAAALSEPSLTPAQLAAALSESLHNACYEKHESLGGKAAAITDCAISHSMQQPDCSSGSVIAAPAEQAVMDLCPMLCTEKQATAALMPHRGNGDAKAAVRWLVDGGFEVLETAAAAAVAAAAAAAPADDDDDYSRLNRAIAASLAPDVAPSSSSPTFKPEVTWAEVGACQLCYVTFGLVNRRHHCRCCGKSACNKCSLARMPLPQIHGPQRVCKICCDKHLVCKLT